ncbi:MAG: sigma-70 family RNA polymerase sigma factor [Thermomicrobiales bacterium]|nr:sigma-70 family RNA polymerase sigma factor [Thermomicrobiales bacterium]
MTTAEFISTLTESVTRDAAASAPLEGSDDELVERARQDPAAFASLYQRHVRSIYAYCHSRLGNRELAEDATSQIFTNALSGLARYRSGSFRGWLYAIARNVVTDQRRQMPFIPEEALRNPVAASGAPDSALQQTDSDIDLRLLLDQLTSDQREVVELRLAGLTGIEIAQALGKRHGAVRATQFRAYQRLREILANEGTES